MLSVLLDAITAKVVEKLYDGALGLIHPGLEQRFTALEEQLSQLSDNVEQLMLAPLRAGLRFSKFGDWRKARDAFVLARATDSASPVAAACLAESLIRMGQRNAAVEDIRASIAANPFLLPLYEAALPGLPSVPLSTLWKIQFPPTHIQEGGRTRNLIARISRQLQPRTGAISEIVGSSGDPLAVWYEYANDVRRHDRRLLTSMDATTGAVRWSAQINGDVCLAAPAHICIAESSHERVRLLDPVTGRSKRIVSAAYFGIAYQPNIALCDSAPRFRAVSVSPAEAYKATARGGEANVNSRALSTDLHWPGKPLDETLTAELLSTRATLFRAYNTWQHWHSDQTLTSGSLAPTCSLICASTLECFVASPSDPPRLSGPGT